MAKLLSTTNLKYQIALYWDGKMQLLSKIISIAMVMFVTFGIVGCGEQTPQNLRMDFEEKAESMLSVMTTVMSGGKTMPRPMIKCVAKKITDMFSDEEIRLIMDSSFSERMNNPEKIMRIQRKMESDEIINMAILQCTSEIKNKE